MHKKQEHTVWWLIGSLVMMAAGFIIMPKLIKFVSAKLYKYGRGEIIIDDQKPEIFRRYTRLGEE